MHPSVKTNYKRHHFHVEHLLLHNNTTLIQHGPGTGVEKWGFLLCCGGGGEGRGCRTRTKLFFTKQTTPNRLFSKTRTRAKGEYPFCFLLEKDL